MLAKLVFESTKSRFARRRFVAPSGEAGVLLPDYPAPVIRNAGDTPEMVLVRWGMPPPLGPAVRQ